MSVLPILLSLAGLTITIPFPWRWMLRLLGRGGGTADAEFFLHEDFGKAEAAAAEFPGFVVGEEFYTFFSHFSEEYLPCFLTKVIDREQSAVLAFAALLFGLAAALLFFAAEALLFPAGLFCLAAGLFGFAA